MNADKQAMISIIVPVYNTAAYVGECIQSIVNQTYRNIELILVDDGSTDGSDRICQALSQKDKRIKYIRQSNSGVVKARIRGIDNACGKYLMFVDSDDWIEKGMVEFLSSHIGESDLVTTGVFYEMRQGVVSEYLDKYMEGYYDEYNKESVLNTMLFDEETNELQRLTPWMVNKLYHSSIVREIKTELNMEMKLAEDAVFLYKYLLKCRSIVICHDCFYHYRYRQESAFHRANPHILIDINLAYLSLLQDFREHPLNEKLVYQLQRWISVMVIMALNGQMGFENGIHIPEFLIDTEGLKDKKIVLYGAGKMGKDYYSQLTKMGYQIVMWVDSQCAKEQNIKSPSDILTVEYDVILVAVSKYEYVRDIISTLQNMGIGEDKIIWKRPVRLN